MGLQVGCQHGQSLTEDAQDDMYPGIPSAIFSWGVLLAIGFGGDSRR